MSIADVLSCERAWRVEETDCLAGLRAIPAESVSCVVTSPPYYALRDYGVAGQIGLESTFSEFLANLVDVFREVRRVLRPDGVCWINMGDSFAGSGKGQLGDGSASDRNGVMQATNRGTLSGGLPRSCDTLPPKSLVGQPWRLAFALQDDGWILRQDVIWHKPAPMPESVTDRCTRAHEYLFMLVKSGKYYYDADAIREKASSSSGLGLLRGRSFADPNHVAAHAPSIRTRLDVGIDSHDYDFSASGRNTRSVWTIAPEPSHHDHYATFPTEIPRRCIAAGCPPDGIVLDPFCGTASTGVAARRLGRRFIGLELSPKYVQMSRRRLSRTIAIVTAEQATADEAPQQMRLFGEASA